jgi:MFS family permease
MVDETLEVAKAAPTTTSLWRNGPFNLLWTSQSLSDLGNAMADLAVTLLVLQMTGSAVQAGVVATTSLVVGLVCRLPAGVLADRFDRRRLMITCDAARLAPYFAHGVRWVSRSARSVRAVGWRQIHPSIFVAMVRESCSSSLSSARTRWAVANQSW